MLGAANGLIVNVLLLTSDPVFPEASVVTLVSVAFTLTKQRVLESVGTVQSYVLGFAVPFSPVATGPQLFPLSLE